MKNISTEKIIIGVLTILLLSLGTLWFFDNSNGDKERSRIEERNEKLEKEKNILTKEKTILIKEFDKKTFSLDSLKEEYTSLDKKFSVLEKESKKDRARLEQNRREREAMRIKIDEIKSNPIKRTGTNLLESIKQKTADK